jgi:acetyl esterase/lipase
MLTMNRFISRRISAVILFLTGFVFGAEPVIRRDVPYLEPKNERQSLDVFAPADAKNCPIVIWIHGGGWQRGDKSGVLAKPGAFVNRGYVFIPINYRFIPHVTIREMSGDVARAIRWAHDNARNFGGDPDSIFVMGHSAGAQLAALVCIDERYLKGQGLELKNIKGCVPVDGDTYFPALQIDTAEPRRAASYKIKFPEGTHRDLSSVVQIAKDKGIPPFLIVHVADHPESGTALQSTVLAHYLTMANVPAQTHAAPGKTHVSLDADLGTPDDKPTKAIFEFMAATTKAPRS